MSLYSDLTDAGIQTDNHYSDLYFPANAESAEILKKYPLQKSIATIFHCNLDGCLWYDVTGAFEPYWEKRA